MRQKKREVKIGNVTIGGSNPMPQPGSCKVYRGRQKRGEYPHRGGYPL